MSNRLQRFREYLRRFDAAGDPSRALDKGFVVEHPAGSISKTLEMRLGLRPHSSHLIVGGVGSGKTTQLLLAEKHLNALEDVKARVIDVSAHQDIGKLEPGVLLVLGGLALGKMIEEDARLKELWGPEQKEALNELEMHARGFWIDADDGGAYTGGLNYIQGIVTAPPRALDHLPHKHRDAFEAIESIQAFLAAQGHHAVLLFDGLDRLGDVKLFEKVISAEIPAFQSLGIGVAVVGPLRALYGLDRPIAERFDYFYHQSPIDIPRDEQGRAFLQKILRARLPAEVLPDATCLALIEWSGGVLRDLIALAQLACEEAYLHGSEPIAVSDVARAADAFGRKHLLGLGTDEVEVLQRVRKKGTFVQSSEKDLALLVTRRVLEYNTDGRVGYMVHPTLAPLLEAIEKPE